MRPHHVAIIMDGNGRWAEEHGLPRSAGHAKGAEAVRQVVRHARRANLDWLTLFAFSSQNWGRPTEEVQSLMELFALYLDEQRQELIDNGVRLCAIGEREYLPAFVRERLTRVEAETAHLSAMNLVLAVSYDGRRDMVRAVRHLTDLASRGLLLPADVTEAQVSLALSTGEMPDVDLLIRTSGEQRLSGFLPFEACYAELYFTERHWPDFDGAALDAAIESYGARERRFGLASGQLSAFG